jgi:hypothetical protein
VKILHLDVETAPLTVHSWALWDQNISLAQIVEGDYMLCWAAKWDGQREMHFDSLRASGQKRMMASLHALVAEADMVVTYNGDRFDLPWLNTEFFKAGLTPPRPCASYDLLPPIRRKFRLPSYKLAYVAKFLGVGSKVKHEGHDLWKACIKGDAKAWARMERYNKGDVRLQERVYHKVRSWLPSHPNAPLIDGETRPACPRCKSTRMTRQGFQTTRAGRYPQFQCQKCGGWMTDKRRMGPTSERRPA